LETEKSGPEKVVIFDHKGAEKSIKQVRRLQCFSLAFVMQIK